MSFDNQATLNVPNMQHEKPKSGALKWILGGCGCLGLLAVVCIGGFAYFFSGAIGDAIRMQQETQAMIESSPQVEEALGSPIEIGPPRTQNGPEGEVTFEFDVTGPNGTGTVFSKTKMNPSTFRFERKGLYMEFEGQRIDLNLDIGDIDGLDE
jgi:hypothetical protein